MCIRDSCSPPIPRNYTLHKRFVTQLPNPINHHLASVLDHFTVISSIPADLPFFNFLALPITSSLLMTSSPKYLFLLEPSNPHTFIITSSLLSMLCRFSKCSHHTLVTFISSVTKVLSLFIILCKFLLFLIYLS